ncbi:MAG: transposase [Parcubacteria group bacterium]
MTEIREKYKNKYRIRSSRLKGYDYSQNGIYFITICTKNREEYFGKIENGIIILSDIGKIAEKFWQEIPSYFSFVILDEYIVMPNHVHGIVEINGNNSVETQFIASKNQPGGITGNNNPSLNPFSLSTIIKWYKGRCAFEIRKQLNSVTFAWQSRFYDHIIRNEISLNKIREYIRINPEMWEHDRNNKDDVWI